MIHYCSSDIPLLSAFTTGMYSFTQTTSLSLISLIIWFCNILIFLNYSLSQQDTVPSENLLPWVWLVNLNWFKWFDLPQLTTFTAGHRSFHHTQSLNLISIITSSWLLYLPKLTTFTTRSSSFDQTTSITLSSNHSFSFSSDVPFNNGNYTTDANSKHSIFKFISSSSISSDCSTLFYSSSHSISIS